MGLRIGGQLPTYGRLRAGGTRAKGERMEGGEYACPFFFESNFFWLDKTGVDQLQEELTRNHHYSSQEGYVTKT